MLNIPTRITLRQSDCIIVTLFRTDYFLRFYLLCYPVNTCNMLFFSVNEFNEKVNHVTGIVVSRIFFVNCFCILSVGWLYNHVSRK
jgi:hypothetical protein